MEVLGEGVGRRVAAALVQTGDDFGRRRQRRSGDGPVDQKAGPGERVQTLWVVTFEPGDYRYICDPHPSMNGQFTVS